MLCPDKVSLGFLTTEPHPWKVLLFSSWGEGCQGALPVQKPCVLVSSLLLVEEEEEYDEEKVEEEYDGSGARPIFAFLAAVVTVSKIYLQQFLFEEEEIWLFAFFLAPGWFVPILAPGW